MNQNRLKNSSQQDLSALVVQTFPGPDIHYELALSRFERKDFKSALGSIKEAMRPGVDLSEEGRIAWDAERLPRLEANRRFEREVRYLEAEICFMLEDYRGCTEACKAVLKIEPADAHSYLLTGRAESSVGSYILAKDDFIHAVRLFDGAGDEANAKRARLMLEDSLNHRGR